VVLCSLCYGTNGAKRYDVQVLSSGGCARLFYGAGADQPNRISAFSPFARSRFSAHCAKYNSGRSGGSRHYSPELQRRDRPYTPLMTVGWRCARIVLDSQITTQGRKVVRVNDGGPV